MGKLTRGNRNIRWIETHCRVPEGRYVGRPVRLAAFQKKIIRGIYDTPTRMAIVSVGRKNAKTSLAAMLLLLHLVGPESKPNSNLYSAAQSRDQASILFALAAKMVKMSPDLSADVGIRETVKVLVCEELGTQYRALSADASTTFGLSAALVIHDELGQVVGPRSALFEALETSQSAHDEPLSIVISTQAPTDNDLMSMLIDSAATGEDPLVKLFLWTANEDINPFTKQAIKQANPAFEHFMNQEEVLFQARSAERMPAREADYRNLVLNQRVNRANPFVSAALWKANGEAPREEDFRGGVRVGLDLSERNDLTALIVTGEGEDKQTSVKCYFFAPSEGVRERAAKDRVPYDLWAEQGHLILTEGATVDYGHVAKALVDIHEEYGIVSLHFDRWRMKYLRRELEILGVELPLHDHGQGFVSMAPALDAFESDLLNKRLRHGGHPILKWNAANAVVVKDPAGNRKLDKSKSTGRIDGMVALAMTRTVDEAEGGSLNDFLMSYTA